MSESISFLAGVIIGIISSIPFGPINLAIMIRALSNKTKEAIAIGIGSGFMDVVYCSAAMFGVASIVNSGTVKIILQLTAIIVFFIFGVRSFLFGLPKQELEETDIQIQKGSQVKRSFAIGVVLYLSNPGYIPYWLTIASILQGFHVINSEPSVAFSFAIGTGVGTVSWFLILIELIEKFKMRFSEKNIKNVTKIFGTILIVASLFLLYNFLISHKLI